MQFVTSNALCRTFFLQYKNSVGTCFVIDIDKHQYLVTAKHVVDGINANDICYIFRNGAWCQINTTLIGKCNGAVDIVVLALDFQLCSEHLLLPATLASIAFGQDCYFLGFPFGMMTNVDNANNYFPIPFIKKAIISSIVTDQKGYEIIYLDGHNNPGFSGGPVVIHPVSGSRSLHVISVISGYRFDPQPVFMDETKTPLVSRHNTGIIITYSIRHAVDVIKANPVGFPLPNDDS